LAAGVAQMRPVDRSRPQGPVSADDVAT